MSVSRGIQQDIALPLVISLSVEMLDIFAQRPPQRALTEKNDLRDDELMKRLREGRYPES